MKTFLQTTWIFTKALFKNPLFLILFFSPLFFMGTNGLIISLLWYVLGIIAFWTAGIFGGID